jgi:hypothetical protein
MYQDDCFGFHLQTPWFIDSEGYGMLDYTSLKVREYQATTAIIAGQGLR